MRTKIQAANPGQENKVNELFSNAYLATLPVFIPQYVEYMASIFAKNFSSQEIDAMMVYYKTDMSQKFMKAAYTHEKIIPTAEEKNQMQIFSQSSLGQKLRQASPEIMKKMSVYLTDVMSPKQLDMVNGLLRQELPKNGLRVPLEGK